MTTPLRSITNERKKEAAGGGIDGRLMQILSDSEMPVAMEELCFPRKRL